VTPKRYDLKQVIERELEKADGIEITAGRKTFRIPPPTLWPDVALVAAAAEDLPTATRALLGKDYDAFVEAGGNSALLFTILAEAHGATPGESSASTDS
jgi:hypothetical protein